MRKLDKRAFVVARFRFVNTKFLITLHCLLLIWLIEPRNDSVFLLQRVKEQSGLLRNACLTKRKYVPNLNVDSNRSFTTKLVLSEFIFTCILFALDLLLCCGDIHPNPGPDLSFSSSDQSSMTTSFTSSLHLSNCLSMVHYNIQSIFNKLDLISAELNNFDILTFSETWLGNSTNTDDIAIPSFHLPERKDRQDNHGGVLIYIRDTIKYRRRQDLELLGLECIWVEIYLFNKHLLLGTLYRPPSSNSSYFDMIEDTLHLAVDTGIDDIVLTGDFNYNMLNPSASRKVLSLCQQFNLSQIINEPTHFTEHSNSLIDIILVKNNSSIISCGVGDPFLNQEKRYHCPVFALFKFHKPKQSSYTRKIYKYDQGDYELLRQKADQTDWTSLKDDNIENYANQISEKIIEITDQCIPNKIVRIKPSDQPWINSSIKRKIRARKRAYKKAKATNAAYHWQKFRTIRNETITCIRKSKKSFYDNLSNKLLKNDLSPRDWWKTLKSFISKQNNTSLPTLENNGVLAFESIEKANLLNDYFANQTILNEKEAEIPNLPLPTNHLLDFTLSTEEVLSVLKSLPLGKAAGPDGINNKILREISNELATPLCDLFNMSLKDGNVPSAWKEAHVSAIFKKGDPSYVGNYRPISLLSNLDKILERLMFKHLYNYLLDIKFITPFQSGFIPGDCTVNQLTFLYNSFCKALDDGKEIRIVFFDISKAFDRVWHRGLLAKLNSIGLSKNLLNWFENYLRDRRQRVVIPGAKSDWASIYAGVPQGSILGPLLFLIFINDIVRDIHSNIRLFADDTSLYLVVDHANHAADCLNSDISKITEWAKTWLVSFNPAKTESLLISRKVNKPVHPPLSIFQSIISEVESHKHLGIHFSKDGNWRDHIEYIKSKAWNRVNIMRKLKFIIDRKSLETIYISFIRPILEYSNVVWDNCTSAEKSELEKIQHEAARIAIGGTKLISINNLMKETGWESLQERRRKHKLVLFYKMVKKQTPEYLSSLVPQAVSSGSRYSLRNAENLQAPRGRTKLYSESFLPSTVRDWNSLPLEVRQAPSVSSFKYSINSPCENPVPPYYYIGNRQAQILHTRLRTNCSSLNLALFQKNIVDSPLCLCGQIESVHHFFLTCPLYNDIRTVMLDDIRPMAIPTVKLFLFGNPSLDSETNGNIFASVQRYIVSTNRFK